MKLQYKMLLGYTTARTASYAPGLHQWASPAPRPDSNLSPSAPKQSKLDIHVKSENSQAVSER